MSYLEDRLNVNGDGAIVLQGVAWHRGSATVVLSVYGYTGKRSKRRETLRRIAVEDCTSRAMCDTMLHNMAMLWAMENGISNFVFTDRRFDPYKTLTHPATYREQQLKENQPCQE